MACIFCKIINNEIEASIVYEDELCLAFMDINPINPGHVLIVPKTHQESVAELSDTSAAHLMIIANSINRALRRADINCEGINYFLTDGDAAGQEVAHAHLHCIPRFRKDGFKLKFPDSYKNKPSREDLNKIAEELNMHINEAKS